MYDTYLKNKIKNRRCNTSQECIRLYLHKIIEKSRLRNVLIFRKSYSLPGIDKVKYFVISDTILC